MNKKFKNWIFVHDESFKSVYLVICRGWVNSFLKTLFTSNTRSPSLDFADCTAHGRQVLYFLLYTRPLAHSLVGRRQSSKIFYLPRCIQIHRRCTCVPVPFALYVRRPSAWQMKGPGKIPKSPFKSGLLRGVGKCFHQVKKSSVYCTFTGNLLHIFDNIHKYKRYALNFPDVSWLGIRYKIKSDRSNHASGRNIWKTHAKRRSRFVNNYLASSYVPKCVTRVRLLALSTVCYYFRQ